MANLNARIFNEAKAIAALGCRFAFAMSLGRDSAVMLHVMSQLTDISTHRFFTWTHLPKLLPYQVRYLEQVEDRYGISVDVHVKPDDIGSTQAAFASEYMAENACDFALFGYRMDESLQRRGMLNKFADGIDHVRRWAYPLRSFTKRTVRAYAKSEHVPLSVEYSFGMDHEMFTFRGPNSFRLRHYISEEDYRAAVAMDPDIEIDYVRTCMSPEVQELRRVLDGKV